jgi:UDP-glucuronate 4-epimerase
MRALVTGAAGFVGSHLSEALVGAGWEVIGVDCLTPYYDIGQKKRNLAAVAAAGGDRFEHRDLDLRTAELAPAFDGVDVVFHQAAQPGVRASWDIFDTYVEHNLLATHRLLEEARRHPIRRFVYASSSSVYGDAPTYPTREDSPTNPRSPYGVTKLSAEQLCGVYAANWGMPTIALRYFTVFGPRQRPDMAMHRLIEAALHGGSFPMYGTGDQVRDFTYVADVVAANLAAASVDAREVAPGAILNVAGGDAVTLAEVVAIIEGLAGRHICLDRQADQAGDVVRTGGSTTAALELLHWKAAVSVAEGLASQVAWHRCQKG